MTQPQPVPTVTADQVPVPVPEGLVVLDVREDDEWQAGHIEGALHIPLPQLPARTDEVASAAQVLCVCKGGGRSARATMLLRRSGVEAVNLDGGMHGWAAAGHPMVSETGQAPDVL
jgi:rhodanese-related sulfurtransferase